MKIILLWAFLAVSFINAQTVVINEIVARNSDNRLALGGCNSIESCPDYIELHNTTNTVIDISNYFLSDEVSNTTKWQVPAGTTIDANGFLLIYGADLRNAGFLNFNFNLSAAGETIVLSDNSGVEIQSVTYPPSPNDIAYGRLSNGNYSFMNPSPEVMNMNSDAIEFLDSNLQISIPSGVYSSTQSITITHSGLGSVFYTIDGTTPTSTSIPYTGPITIASNTVLKAIVIENANRFSFVENRSYIFGANHDLPIILLTSDNSSLGLNNKEIIDGRVEFTFIESNGDIAVNQYANFRASGNVSRFTIPQLNGKVEASEVYGDDDFDYKMYPYKDIDEFEGFLFRNSSQDWFTTHIRDAFVSRLIGKDNLMDVPFEGYRPAVIYVNGTYGGFVNIKEDDDSNYVRNNFDLGRRDFRRTRRSFINPSDPLPTDRNALNDVINFNSYNNARFLRNFTTPGELGISWWEDLSGKSGQRYHYMLHDFDPILGFRNRSKGIIDPGPMDISGLLADEIAIIPEYRAEALQFIAATINHIYNVSRTLNILNEMEAEIESEMEAQGQLNVLQNNRRTRPLNNLFHTNLMDWKENVDIVRTNLMNRIDADIFNRMQTEYSLDIPVQITYNSSNINQGFVRVQGVKVQNQTDNGMYFSNLPLKLSAEALPGFRFVRWEGDVNSTSLDIAPVFTTTANITAVFEPVPVVTNLAVINEIQGKNDITIADENGEFDDWIEIYNPSSSPINLAGLYFSDNLSEPLKWQIPNTDAAKTTVPANGYLLLWADNDTDQGENHLGFKLKGSDQVIVTYPDGLTEKQRVIYNNVDTDESFGASSDGDTNFVLFTNPTPNASNNGIVLSINDLTPSERNNNEISVYPNPTNSKATISGLKTNTAWQLYNLGGVLTLQGNSKKLDMSTLSSGVYFITFQENNKSIKVIKK